MKRVVLALILCSLGACDDAQVKDCEASILAKLKSPASYKRVTLSQGSISSSIHKPPYDSVTITYDAANSFNALLRDNEICFYRPGTTERIEPFKAETEAELQKVLNSADVAASQADEALKVAGRDEATSDQQSAISPEGAKIVANAVTENQKTIADDPRDSCLANATTTEEYGRCPNASDDE